MPLSIIIFILDFAFDFNLASLLSADKIFSLLVSLSNIVETVTFSACNKILCHLEMFYLNTIEQLFLFVEQIDQLEVCLPCSRLPAGIPILVAVGIPKFKVEFK